MSQINQIINKLNTDGYVSRNWALERYIGRLAARIDDLEKEGWTFRTEIVPENGGKNYYYYLLSKPEVKPQRRAEMINGVPYLL